MPSRLRHRAHILLLLLAVLLLSACSPLSTLMKGPDTPTPIASTPEWFGMQMTDVITGQDFTINDFAGKVVLVETMATWCPTCSRQGDEVKKLLESLDSASDLVTVSLDVDLHEDASTLKEFATSGGYTWRFAVAPLLVQRALGNLYNANYLNPPLAPMLFIDRQGSVHDLPYGLKSAEALRKTLEPYLKP
jgi:thiol-disulfide isomerase/thioredoxin